MQNKKFSVKLVSLLLLVASLMSLFSVFAFATTEEASAVNNTLDVLINRDFDEGWNYSNGFSDANAGTNKVAIKYELTDSGYNHYLRFEKAGANNNYVAVADSSPSKNGKTYVEFDLASSLNNTLGQAIIVSVQGDLKTLVEFKNDGIYILGQNVGYPDYAMTWESVAFEFDFDYSENTSGAQATAYKVTAYHKNAIVASQIYNCGLNGFGVSQVRFAFGNNNNTNGQWYAIDNVKVYSGVDEFTVIDDNSYGSAVNTSLALDFPLATLATGQDGFLYGEPNLDRQENPKGLVNHYNRHYGEGWTYDNYYTRLDRITIAGNTNEYSIKKEKVGDEYNHFLRFRALSDIGSFLQIPIVEAPGYGRLVIELDIKSGVNTHLGGIVQVKGSEIDYILSIENGQLIIFDQAVGYIGNDWVKVVFSFNYQTEDGLTYCTVHYGKDGYMKVPFSYNTINGINIGTQGGVGEEGYGDWYAIDNLQIYSGLKDGYAKLDPNDYGKGVYTAADKTVDLGGDVSSDDPIDPDMPDIEAGDRVNVTTNGYVTGSPDFERIEYNSEEIWLQYHRTYSEGWSFGVGGGVPKSSISTIENEQLLDLTYNYFQRYEITDTTNSYWSLMADTSPKTGKIYLEFDLRATEGATLTGIIQLRNRSGEGSGYILSVTDGYLIGYDGTRIGKVSEHEWVHIIFEIDYTYASSTPGSDPNSYKLRTYVGDSWYTECVLKGKTDTTTFGLHSFRIGFQTPPASSVGQFWDLDNLTLYAADTYVDVPDTACGNAINPSTPKDFPIQTNSISLQQMINESLLMKVGSDFALIGNTRQPIMTNETTGVVYGAPKKINDTVWIPLDAILNFLDYPIYQHEDGLSFDISTGSSVTYITLGRDTASVAGKKVQLTAAPCVIAGENEYLAIASDDIETLFPGFWFSIDDMNLIIFSKHETFAKNPLDEPNRINLMTSFIYEFSTAEEIYDMAEEYTNNFDHPYIYANQSKFDELYEVWQLGQQDANDGDIDNTAEYNYDTTLYQYITSIVKTAMKGYNIYSKTTMDKPGNSSDAAYEGLVEDAYIYDSEVNGKKGLQQPFKDTAGYDPIGNDCEAPYDYIVEIAYAYQVTRDERFARMVYDYAHIIVNWNHWGPGHYLDTADTTGAMAIVYDWCYDIWTELGLDTIAIADGIYYHGVLQGYLIVIGKPDPHGRPGGNGTNYATKDNNWNAVCTNGVATGAFALMNYTGYRDTTTILAAKQRVGEYGGTKVPTVCSEVVSLNFRTLVENGLDIYAPDGSYAEGVNYWGYGAGNLFEYAALLETVLGNDLGIMDTWGLDRTCRSILHMVSSDDVSFGFNDSPVGGTYNSNHFSYVAHALDDNFLNIIRRDQIGMGKAPSMWDTFFFVNAEDLGDVELELQYHHVGIHGYTMRSSWERGALFAGMLGGNNDDPHGHLDAGQWIYYNKGVSWIQDIGPDDYDSYNYFGNNHMYKTTVEGHSCIILTSVQDSVPAGQIRNSISPILTTGDNEYGAYATFNTLPAYGTAGFSYVNRGILLTNDRKTVVIQDEIIPNGAQTFYWLAHYNNRTVSRVEISEDGRTVYMTAVVNSTTTYTLRIQMVSSIRRGISFEKMTSQDYLLDATMRPGDSIALGGKKPEQDRSMYSKIAVRFEDLTFYEFAVAIEIIDPDDPVDVGYSFTKMSTWEPVPDTRTNSGNDNIPDEDLGGIVSTKRTGVTASEVPMNLSRLNNFYNAGTMFTTDISKFYKTITSMTFAVNKYGRDNRANTDDRADYDGEMRPAIDIYDEYYAMYDAYYTSVDKVASQIAAITTTITGG